MSKNQTMSGHWVNGKNHIKCNLALIIFKEDDYIITFCPALDLSGYGSTEEEAKRSFEITVSEYFRYILNKKMLAEDLEKHGWTIGKSLKKEPVPPTMEHLLRRNEDFNRIFNTHDFQKRNTTIDIPALV